MPPEPPHEISGPLAERYCDMVDLLRTVPLDELDAQIARLQKLRDAVARVQGTPPVVEATPELETFPVHTIPQVNGTPNGVRSTPHPHKRRPDGYWMPVVVRVLRESDAPMQLKSILERAVELGLADERDGVAVISHVLHVHPDKFGSTTRGVWKLRDSYREILEREGLQT